MAKVKLQKTDLSEREEAVETKNNTNNSKIPFALEKQNYLIMFVGLGLMLLGFFIMSMDKEPYGFGFLGLTLGPIILFIGFLVQIGAIFYKPKN